jgi:hypothetical protein
MITQQSASAVPQQLLYQNTRVLEKQVGLLEDNQKNITDIMNKTLNDNSLARNQANLRNEIYNDNRKMLTDVVAPLNQQVIQNFLRILVV